MAGHKVKVWLAGDGWRWHRQAGNNEIVAESGEGYVNQEHAITMALELNKDLPLTSFRIEDGE